MKLTETDETRRKLQLDEVRVNHQTKYSGIKERVVKFMCNDMKSVTVPDKKVKAGTRYRLASLEHRYEKFLAECERVDDIV